MRLQNHRTEKVIRCVGRSCSMTLAIILTLTFGSILGNLVSDTCSSFNDDIVDFSWSFQQCMYQCKLDSACIAISYHHGMLLCKLHFHNYPTSACSGYVYTRKIYWTQAPYTSQYSSLYECEGNVPCYAASRCPPLYDPVHGKLLGNRFTEGHKVTVFCNPGYLLTGSKQRKCVSGNWTGQEADCIEDPECVKYLVSGPNPVEDNQLSESVDWCTVSQDPACLEGYTTAKYSRINSTGLLTGGWLAGVYSGNASIQVDFIRGRNISAVVLQGRSNIDQYVTGFKTLLSNDCITFQAILETNGTDKIFQGTTGANDIVIRPLAVRKRVRCVRIQPITWVNHPALRFDILGC